MAPASPDSALESASLIVTDPSGHRTRLPITPVPFLIGRAPENHLILRDTRASRTHARILAQQGGYQLEDCGSRHGTFVNGKRIARHALTNSDRIEFGSQDSYQVVFALDGVELKRLMEQMGPSDKSAVAGVGGNLSKLRAILELARTVQGAFSVDDVLASVVDTALAITGAERGFLMMRVGNVLETRVARHRQGQRLHESELRIPRAVLERALNQRRELLSMNFDPLGSSDTNPSQTIANLELRSVICVPLVRIRTSLSEVTNLVSTGNETVGVLYMDSRAGSADLAGGNRELLQTLAIEASTVIENARLLEEESVKRQMEEDLRLARIIQQSLLPATLPAEGWLHASGSSVASLQVGGDYFDVTRLNERCWSVVVADVSGKGVGSALLASLLQGALIAATQESGELGRRMRRLNQFLNDRTGGEKYATVFHALVEPGGHMSYVNAAHCPPIIVRAAGGMELLESNAMPVGLLEAAEFPVAEASLGPGDKLVIYSDGVTEAQNADGEFFGKKRLREIVKQYARESCAAIHAAIHDAVAIFAGGATQSDDITVVVIEFRDA
jgi:serine phosphatase RsbU (regulator of sigma subunit)